MTPDSKTDKTFNPDQRKAIDYLPAPLLILAGAGTGKTTTLIARIARMVCDLDAAPASILALTFTVKAAENLKQELVKVIGSKGAEIHAHNFHSFAQTVTDLHWDKLGFRSKPAVMDDADVYFLLKENFEHLPTLNSADFKRDPIVAIRSFKQLFDRFRDDLLTESELADLVRQSLDQAEESGDEKELEHAAKLADAVRVFPWYQKWKKETNQIDFGDMITLLNQLIENEESILYELQNRYQHIFVDEFQDNNYALSQLIVKIAEPGNSITVVGDDDQCIYSFRGANIENVLQFKSRYNLSSETGIVELKLNYRSTQEILDLANISIAENPGRLAEDNLLSPGKKGPKPLLVLGDNAQQIHYIADEIHRLHATGVVYSQIAILQRTHGKCILTAEALSKMRIPVSYTFGMLFEQPEIKDLIAYIQVFAGTPLQDQALFRLLKKKFNETLAQELWHQHRIRKINNPFLVSVLSGLFEVTDDVHEFCKCIQTGIDQSEDKTIREIVFNILVQSGLYKQDGAADLECQRRIRILNQFQEITDGFSKRYSENDLEQFARYVNVLWEVNTIPGEPEKIIETLPAVQLMTVHNAKGLQFEYVFIPFLNSAGFPANYRTELVVSRTPLSWRRWTDAAGTEKEFHQQEERRLFYVAVTRAKSQLYLCGPAKRQSIFIKDLNTSIIHKKELPMLEAVETSRLEDLHSEFETRLLRETGAGNYAAAENIIQAMSCIHILKNGGEPDWQDNPLKPEILAKLAEYKPVPLQVSDLKLSATRISRYEECPLKYKYKDIDGIPEKPSRPYLNLGIIIHRVLEVFHTEQKTELDDLLQLLNEHWIEGGFEYSQEQEQYKEDAVQMLTNYFHYQKKNPPSIFSVEKVFDFVLPYCEITGKCDRIDVTESGEITIVDYKTSRSKKKESEAKKDIQLAIYALYSVQDTSTDEKGRQLGRIPDNLKLIYLRHEEPEVSIHLDADKLEEFTDRINAVALEIRSGNFEPCKGRHCDYCDYKDLICPEWK